MVTGNARVEVKFTASEKEAYVISTDPALARKEREERAARIAALKKLQSGDSKSTEPDENNDAQKTATGEAE